MCLHPKSRKKSQSLKFFLKLQPSFAEFFFKVHLCFGDPTWGVCEGFMRGVAGGSPQWCTAEGVIMHFL